MRIRPHAEAALAAHVDTEAAATKGAPAAPTEPGAFARMVHGLGKELDRGEALTARALGHAGSGTTLAPTELLALQAGIYRYGEAVDSAAKLVDRAAGAVKTTLQSQ